MQDAIRTEPERYRPALPSSLLRLASAFLRRDWAVATSYRFPFVFGLVSSVASLFLFYYLGRFIQQPGPDAPAELAQGYFAFAVLGYSVLSIMETGMSVFVNRLNTDQATGTLEVVFASPTPSRLTVLLSATYQLCYATVDSAIGIVLAVVFFDLRFDAGVVGAVFALAGLLATIALFSAVGVALGAAAVIFKRVTGLVGVAALAIGLLGGVWFPVEVFPPVLEWVAKALPFTWAIDVVREALLADTLAWAQLVYLVIAAAILLPASMWVLGRAVDHAKRTGTLHQY